MANEKETVAKETRGGIGPFLIIGLILLATIAGIWWISRSGKNPDTATESTNTGDAAQTQQAKSNYDKAPPGAVPARFKGSSGASIIVEEFADFQCGACAQKHSVFNEVNAIYGSKIKFVFRHFPLITQHAKAYDAAVATEAAGFQNKFWEMQNLIFANQLKWMNDPNHRKIFEGYAKTLNIDVDRFSNDSLGLNAKNRVDADMRRGNAIGLRSTPSVFVNGKAVPFETMSVDGMRKAIDAEIERMTPKEEDKNDAGKDSDSKQGDKEEKDESKKAAE